MTLEIDGVFCEILQSFNANRCLVRYEGLAVLADRDPTLGTWGLSGTPATPEEQKVVEAFMPTDELEITQT